MHYRPDYLSLSCCWIINQPSSEPQLTWISSNLITAFKKINLHFKLKFEGFFMNYNPEGIQRPGSNNFISFMSKIIKKSNLQGAICSTLSRWNWGSLHEEKQDSAEQENSTSVGCHGACGEHISLLQVKDQTRENMILLKITEALKMVLKWYWNGISSSSNHILIQKHWQPNSWYWFSVEHTQNCKHSSLNIQRFLLRTLGVLHTLPYITTLRLVQDSLCTVHLL